MKCIAKFAVNRRMNAFLFPLLFVEVCLQRSNVENGYVKNVWKNRTRNENQLESLKLCLLT
jgi:hypothetical protein